MPGKTTVRATSTARAAALAVGLAAVIAVSAGCAHPVGPARTTGAYEGKAVTTAESALSAVETVRLAARTASKGNAFGPYTSVVVSDQEKSLSGLQGTFGSIQPPNERADAIRASLDALLSDALDQVTDVRVAIRRGDVDGLAEVARPLTRTATALERFTEDHG